MAAQSDNDKVRSLTEAEAEILALIRKSDDITEQIATLRRQRQVLLQDAHHLGRVRGLKLTAYRPAQNTQVISIRLLREYVSDTLLDKCSRGHWTPECYVVNRRVLARVEK